MNIANTEVPVNIVSKPYVCKLGGIRKVIYIFLS